MKEIVFRIGGIGKCACVKIYYFENCFNILVPYIHIENRCA